MKSISPSLVQNPLNERFQSPLAGRYASEEMLAIFSNQRKFSTWRKLWLALAESEQELGLAITDDQLNEMRRELDDIDFEKAAEYEASLHHDVMAHIKTFGDACPAAAPIIHLGATSCFVTDNTDLIQMRDALLHLEGKLAQLCRNLADFCESEKSRPTLGFTHFQSAQLTTVGKRFAMYLQDFIIDLKELNSRRRSLRCLGSKGATGTQSSFLTLFENDHQKVAQLDDKIAEKIGFSSALQISGQTYTRKIDSLILQCLSGIASSSHKMATDLRLLAHLGEVTEPFGKSQVGSSAMPYKQNPILSERTCALARFVMSLSQNPEYTHATQWFERTLDDSANRRLCIPEAFLSVDAILSLCNRVISGAQVHGEVIAHRVNLELPFMATETLLMLAVKKGGNRQDLHEVIRKASLKAGELKTTTGVPGDLLKELSESPQFPLGAEEIYPAVNAKDFIGLAPHQVSRFLETEVHPLLKTL